MSVVHSRAQVIAILQGEVTGIARSSGVSHVSEFLGIDRLIVAVFRLDGVLHGTGHGVINTQNRALDQLDFTCLMTTDTKTATTAASITKVHGLSLAPCLR